MLLDKEIQFGFGGMKGKVHMTWRKETVSTEFHKNIGVAEPEVPMSCVQILSVVFNLRHVISHIIHCILCFLYGLYMDICMYVSFL